MFILKVKNKKTNQVEQSDFKTEAERSEHFDKLKKSGYVSDEQLIHHDAVGETPAWDETIPASHDVTLIDTSAEEIAVKTKNDNKKSKRDQRITKLKAMDWTKVKTIADAKDVLQALAEEILKDEE